MSLRYVVIYLGPNERSGDGPLLSHDRMTAYEIPRETETARQVMRKKGLTELPIWQIPVGSLGEAHDTCFADSVQTTDYLRD